MQSNRRGLLSGSVGALLLCVSPWGWRGTEDSAELRVGRAALATLPIATVNRLVEEGRPRRGQSELMEAAAADYREGRTFSIDGVLLSRAEVAHAVAAAMSIQAAPGVAG